MSDITQLSDPRVVRAIELAWREATLLDDKDYEAWANLWDENGMYVVPVQHDATDHARNLNMIHDDERMRRMRVERMVGGYSPSAVAAARTARTVSRFTVVSVDDERVELRASQVLVAYKRNTHSLLGADVELTVLLGSEPGEDRLGGKVVRLLNSEDAVSAAGFLV